VDKTVAGIVLAAGESSRMGRDKALLPIGRETFVQHLIALLRGRVSPLVVVLGHHAEEIEAWITPGKAKRRPGKCAEPEAEPGCEANSELNTESVAESKTEPDTEPITVLHNPDYRLGQLSSLKVAIRHLTAQVVGADVEAVLVALVDHPAISASVVDLLLARFAKSHAPVLIPTCHGRHGHPVVFARSLFSELLDAPLEEGARSVVRRHAAEVELVETEEEGILLDIDLPADYAALLKRLGTGKSEVRSQKSE
jgi:molybdenum cofactor cytidylyltransferase